MNKVLNQAEIDETVQVARGGHPGAASEPSPQVLQPWDIRLQSPRAPTL